MDVLVKNRTLKMWQADILLLITAMVWGSTFGLVKDALNSASPFMFNLVRFGSASLLFLLIFRKQLSPMSKSTLFAGLFAGFFLVFGYGTQTVGLLYTTASRSAFITGLAVVFVPIIIILYKRTWFKPITFIGILTALIGLRLLTLPGENGESFNFGDFLTLLCAVSYAANLVCIEIYTRRYSYIQLAFLQLLFTALSSLPAAFVLETPRWTMTTTLLWALIVTTIGGTLFAFYIVNRVMRFTSATHAAVIFTMEPVFAAVVAHIFYFERLGTLGIIGGVFILIGMIFTEFERQ